MIFKNIDETKDDEDYDEVKELLAQTISENTDTSVRTPTSLTTKPSTELTELIVSHRRLMANVKVRGSSTLPF